MEGAFLSKRKSATHVVLCSLRGQGHVRPMTILSSKLASLGVSVTVIFPDQRTMSSAPTPAQGLDIVFINLEQADEQQQEQQASQVPQRFTLEMAGVRLGIKNTEIRFSEQDHSVHKRSLEALLSKLRSSPSPPACVIVDMLYTWSEEPIAKVGLRRFVFFNGAPNFLALMLHLKSLYNRGILPLRIPQGNPSPLKKEIMDKHHEVHGLPMKIHSYDVPDAMLDDSHSHFDVHMGWLDHLLSCEGLLFNTFVELEGGLFSDLEQKMSQFLLPIGPLFLEETLGDIKPKGPAEEKCQQWLDSQPPGSVVYVSFGSWAALSKQQILELAIGLETSKRKFVWVIPVDTSELQSLLPSGFLQRNSNGLVIPGWAPQQLILKHGSLGAFLTHCGWNSVVECVTLAGVPLVGWPFLGDQPPNCRYLVDGVKIAVEVFGNDEGLVSSDEVKRALTEVMEGPSSQAMRSRVKCLQAAARSALETNGTSSKNMEAFVSKLASFKLAECIGKI